MSLNIAECVTISAQRNPLSEALIFEGTRIDYATLQDQVQRVAAYLQRAGLNRGDRVALLLPNTPHFPIIYYGVLYAGGMVVPLNPLQTPREFRYLFEDAAPAFVFVWSELAAVVEAALVGASVAPELVVVEADLTPVVPASGYSFLTEMARATARPPMAETSPDEVAVIIYTAAYAGRPLGAQLTHFGLFQNAHTVGSRILHYVPSDRCLGVLPLFHSFGQCVLMNTALLAGATLVLMPRFDATKVMECIVREGITILGLVPTMYQFLLGAKQTLNPDLSSLRRVLVGGAAMPPALFDGFRARYGHTILEGYGLTETSPVVSFNMSEAANRPGSVGLPIWGCDVRVVDTEGQTLPAGETGELLVRGHNVMKGYWNKPEINEKILVDGWLHTGDWASLDEAGYIYIKGLKKDMLIRAGLNIYPREIEMVLEEHPDIEAAAVIGVADAVRGEEAHAFIVLRAPIDDLEKQLKRYCREQLAAYKSPRYYTVIDALPRRSDGTIDKDALREVCHS